MIMERATCAWIVGAMLGLALAIGGCQRKSEQNAPPPSSQAPAVEPSSPAQPGASQAPGSDTGTTGAAQGQKSQESKEAQKG